MKIKKVILTVFVVQFVTGMLCASAFAVYPGTFDFNNNAAYIIEELEPGNKVLLYVYFKDKTKKIIDKSKSLRLPSINKSRTLLSFVNMGVIVFYDIEKGKKIYSIPIKADSKITWSDSENKVSYYDYSSLDFGKQKNSKNAKIA